MRDSAQGPDGQVVSLEVPARPGYVVLARLALSAVCRLTPLGDEDVADLKLAVTEAASAFVGGPSEQAGSLSPTPAPAGPLKPVADPAGEGTLRFEFELGEDDLTIAVRCDGGGDVSAEERELSHAIIAATVDDFHTDAGTIRLVKRLVAPAG
ncbi:MAG: ATP-binding protein [Thermoleophilaceae bacterium]